MKKILGTKLNMTQFFSEDGRAYPATVIVAGPATVTKIMSKDKDGYSAVQMGFGVQREALMSKPRKGALKDLGNFRYLREFRVDEKDLGESSVGVAVTVDNFTPGDKVTVTSVSKSKGFQGVVKRYNFKGGPRSHGQKHSEREAGSIGGGLRTRVPKGMRMAGRTGGDTVTVKNLKVLAVDRDTNQILVSGAVPGRRGTLVKIESK